MATKAQLEARIEELESELEELDNAHDDEVLQLVADKERLLVICGLTEHEFALQANSIGTYLGRVNS